MRAKSLRSEEPLQMLALCMDETCQDPEQERPPVGREDGRGQTLVQSAAIVHFKVRTGRDT